MKRCLRVVMLSAVVLGAVALLATDIPTLKDSARAALSVTQGTVKATGLQKPVRVLRDEYGVAHIYAANQHDLFFAQGFVAAQDRLFQMELWKRSGQGRLAEVLGESALGRDVNARLLRYRGDMKAEYESYSPDTKEILEAFTSGINAYIASRTTPGGQGLPFEFQVAGFAPEPWKPEDCLNRMAAFSMTGNSFSELRHAQAVAAVGVERAAALFGFDPAVALDPAPGMDFSGLSAALLRNLVGSDVRIQFPAPPREGSNNWTVSGSLTASGKPLLANDPHRVIAEPSLRYVVHLVAPGWDVIGAGEPALPGVALGHNPHVAWGFTIFGLDQQDLYLEELNPSDRLEYKTAHGWERMRVEMSTFAVKGKPDVTVDLKFTDHGPVLWEDGKRALALRWVGAEPGTAGYLGSLAVDRATNWKEFESAMARWKVPSENIVYADDAGNIGEHSTGLSPLRTWTGLLPVPGTGGYEWTGFLANDKLPHTFNPKSGFVATANHKMIPEGYAYRVGYAWDPGYRARRISEVIAGAADRGEKLGVADMERLQTDVLSLPARELLPLLKQAAGEGASPAEKLMLGWNCVLDRESAAAALYEVWVRELTAEVMKRSAPESLWAVFYDWTVANVLSALAHPTNEMFGDSAGAGRDRMLRETLQSAAEKLGKMQGPDTAKWSWGKLHVMRFRHALDQMPGAAAVMDQGPVERPGDDYTVNSTELGEGYEQVSGASYREILDTSDWDKSVAVNTPGQSGQPGSPHYGDLIPLWDQGKYFPLWYSQAAVEKAAKQKLVLEP